MAFKIAELYAELTIRDSDMYRRLYRTRDSLRKTSVQMEGVSRAAKRMLVVATAAVGGLLYVFGRFEQTMSRVHAITGANQQVFAGLVSSAEELGRTTKFTAKQAGDAMGYLAVAGFKSNEIISSMPAVLNLAAAGQLDMATASNIAAKVMKGMGIEAAGLGRAVDVLAKAFTTSNTDLNQLGEAMKFIGPVARSMGKSIEDVVADIQILSNAGLQGSLAGTTLRNAYTRLAGGVAEAKSKLDALGVVTIDTNGKLRNTADIVDDLNAALVGKGEAEKSAVIMQIFGMRAGPGMSAMLNEGGAALRKFQAQLGDAGGTAKRIADIQMATFFGALTKLKSAAEGLGISLGRALAPTVKALAVVLKTVVGWLNGWSATSKKVVAAVVFLTMGVLALVASLAVGIKILAFMTGEMIVFAGATGKAAAAVMSLRIAQDVANVGVLRSAAMMSKTIPVMLAMGAAAGYAGYQIGKALSPYLMELLDIQENEEAIHDPKYEAAYERKRVKLVEQAKAAKKAAAALREMRDAQKAAAKAAREHTKSMSDLISKALGIREISDLAKDRYKDMGKALGAMVKAQAQGSAQGPMADLNDEMDKLQHYLKLIKDEQKNMGTQGKWNIEKLEKAYKKYRQMRLDAVEKAWAAEDAARTKRQTDEVLRLISAEIRSNGTLKEKLKLLEIEEKQLKKNSKSRKEDMAIEAMTDTKIKMMELEGARKDAADANRDAKKKSKKKDDSPAAFVGIAQLANKLQLAAVAGSQEEAKKQREKDLLKAAKERNKILKLLHTKIADEILKNTKTGLQMN